MIRFLFALKFKHYQWLLFYITAKRDNQIKSLLRVGDKTYARQLLNTGLILDPNDSRLLKLRKEINAS